MGNPDFAVPCLETIFNSRHDLVAVVTNPDKEQGRGRNPRPTPVARFAMRHAIVLIQPDSLKTPSLAHDLEALNADLSVVVGFKILPSHLLGIPKSGYVNLHGSLLPEYRGAAPIQWALMNGDSVTGLTTFILAPKVDTGDIVLKREVVIFPDDDYGTLSRRMSHIGAAVMEDTINLIESGSALPMPQDAGLATRAPKVKPEDCLINWDRTARETRNQIRALSPVPGAYTTIEGKRLKIFKSEVASTPISSPGEIVSVEKGRFGVSCSDMTLEILEVQLEGKRRMPARDFLLGSSISAGVKLGL